MCCGCGVGEGYCEMKVVWRDGGVDVMGTGWPRRAAGTGGAARRVELEVPQAVPIGCGGGGDKARDSQDRTRPEIRTWAVASHGGRSLYMLGRVSGCREEYRAVPEGSGPETGQRDAARSSLSGRSITNKGASLQFRYM